MFKEFKNCTSVPAPSVKVYPAHASNFDFIFVIIFGHEMTVNTF